MTSSRPYRPLPKSVTIKESELDGLGLFAVKNIGDLEILGTTHIIPDRQIDKCHKHRTPLGGFINHSDDANCNLIEHEYFHQLQTDRKIKKGEELTLDYRLSSCGQTYINNFKINK
jgi:SET domain-containing protein